MDSRSSWSLHHWCITLTALKYLLSTYMTILWIILSSIVDNHLNLVLFQMINLACLLISHTLKFKRQCPSIFLSSHFLMQNGSSLIPRKRTCSTFTHRTSGRFGFNRIVYWSTSWRDIIGVSPENPSSLASGTWIQRTPGRHNHKVTTILKILVVPSTTKKTRIYGSFTRDFRC